MKGKPWRKPEENQVKFNWNAELSEPLQTIGLGGLIHETNGEVLASFCSKLNYLVHPVMAEAFALRNALLLCLEL